MYAKIMKKAPQMAPQMPPKRGKIGVKNMFCPRGAQGSQKGGKMKLKIMKNRAKIDVKNRSAKAGKLNENKKNHNN
jgi:hypothetical protein